MHRDLTSITIKNPSRTQILNLREQYGGHGVVILIDDPDVYFHFDKPDTIKSHGEIIRDAMIPDRAEHRGRLEGITIIIELFRLLV